MTLSFSRKQRKRENLAELLDRIAGILTSRKPKSLLAARERSINRRIEKRKGKK